MGLARAIPKGPSPEVLGTCRQPQEEVLEAMLPQRRAPEGWCLLAADCWLLVAGCWPLAGCWLVGWIVAGCLWGSRARSMVNSPMFSALAKHLPLIFCLAGFLFCSGRREVYSNKALMYSGQHETFYVVGWEGFL